MLLFNVFYFRIKLFNVAIRKFNVFLLFEYGLRVIVDKVFGNIGVVWYYKESFWFVFVIFLCLYIVDNK